ncbi:hypothetical protein [Bacillus altitudinis]|uniref:hypothetical protein n=1 Tax=Bacillus altitudinis TaxID=293387 RepID=UPI0022807E8B|nr:hypothetical protein [Bacillus altitudinis]MCY7439377.1 DUF1642 domain-containing protein [Bacillus altitudinis]MEC1142415.1 hypothetical protein [Bacillus altitudinis]
MKPEITKEQAEAIEFLRKHYDDRGILELYAEDTIGHVYQMYGHDCGCVYDLDLIDFASALINGYEIEKSPEQKVRDYYESNYAKHEKSKPFSDDDCYTTGVSNGIRQTLDLLGIEIYGVNVDREEADVDDAPF